MASKDLAPSLRPVIFKWAQFNREDWPYSTPERQWVESATELTAQELYQYWDGIDDVTMVGAQLLVNNPAIRAARHRFQYEALLQEEWPDYATTEARIKSLRREIADIGSEIEAIKGRLRGGVEPVPVDGINLTQTLSNRSVNRLERTRIDLTNLRQDMIEELARLQSGDGDKSISEPAADAGIEKVRRWQEEKRQQASVTINVTNNVVNVRAENLIPPPEISNGNRQSLLRALPTQDTS